MVTGPSRICPTVLVAHRPHFPLVSAHYRQIQYPDIPLENKFMCFQPEDRIQTICFGLPLGFGRLVSLPASPQSWVFLKSSSAHIISLSNRGQYTRLGIIFPSIFSAGKLIHFVFAGSTISQRMNLTNSVYGLFLCVGFCTAVQCEYLSRVHLPS